MNTQIINAIAITVEGQIENIKFFSISDEKKYEEALMKFFTLKNKESELIMSESDKIEIKSGIETAERFYNDEYAIRIEKFAPKFDLTKIVTNFVNGRNIGKGNITISIEA